MAGALAFIALTSTNAQAAEDRLKVGDVHSFISLLNNAVNNVNTPNGHKQLENMILNQATFEDNVNSQTYNQIQWAANPYNNYYGYRYPYYQGYTNVGYRSLNKWEQISKIETKKRTVPGYQAMFELSNITISPLADSAVIDVDFKEQSATYAPNYYGYNGYGYGYGHAPYYYQHVNLNTHSKCKMHLAKMGNNVVYLTRMYCNTSTNLPL